MRKTCRKMERVVRAFAAKHGLDLASSEFDALQLTVDPRDPRPVFMDLWIQTDGAQAGRIAIGHARMAGDHRLPDPVLWVAPTPAGWVPLRLDQIAGSQEGARQEADGKVVITDPLRHAALVQFAEQWAPILAGRYRDAIDIAGRPGDPPPGQQWVRDPQRGRHDRGCWIAIPDWLPPDTYVFTADPPDAAD